VAPQADLCACFLAVVPVRSDDWLPLIFDDAYFRLTQPILHFLHDFRLAVQVLEWLPRHRPSDCACVEQIRLIGPPFLRMARVTATTWLLSVTAKGEC
jgi:hypothetical protein